MSRYTNVCFTSDPLLIMSLYAVRTVPVALDTFCKSPYFCSTKPARGAGVRHGDRPREQLSLSRPDNASLLLHCCTFNAYNGHLFPGKQSAYLADRCHIYLLPNGRINVGSLNSNNLDRFAKAVHEAIMNVPDQETNAQLITA
jgi:hypothetical protein